MRQSAQDMMIEAIHKTKTGIHMLNGNNDLSSRFLASLLREEIKVPLSHSQCLCNNESTSIVSNVEAILIFRRFFLVHVILIYFLPESQCFCLPNIHSLARSHLFSEDISFPINQAVGVGTPQNPSHSNGQGQRARGSTVR